MKIILVTGASGNLGKALIPSILKKSLRVVAVYKKNPNFLKISNGNNLIYEKVDLTSFRQTSSLFNKYRFDYIVHLAGIVKRDSLNQKEMKEVFKANCLATFNIVRNLNGSNIRKFIFTSSMAVYGLPKYLPVDEQHPLNPLDFYGATKMTAENLVSNFCEGNKINFVILRLVSVLTRNEKNGAIYNFVKNARGNRDIELNSEKPRPWDVIYIDDAIKAITSFIKGKRESGIFNVGYGKKNRLDDMARKIILITKSDSKVILRQNFNNPYYCTDTKKLFSSGIRFPPFEKRLKEYIKGFEIDQNNNES